MNIVTSTSEPDTDLAARFTCEVAPLLDMLSRGARRLTRSDADAEDLLQDALMHAYTGFHTFTDGTNVKAWLFRILYNRWVSGYRTKQRRPAEVSLDEIGDWDMSWRPSEASRSAETEFLDALPNNEIKTAMATLPEGFRTAMYYADVLEYTYAETAELMDVPMGTVMSQGGPRKERLRFALAHLADGGGDDRGARAGHRLGQYGPMTFDKDITGLVVIDPYNDFISEGGKVWDRLKGVAELNNCIPHMAEVLDAARDAGIRVFYALHHRYRPGDYETWKYVAPIQQAAWQRRTFEFGTWGGELRPEFEPRDGDIVAQEHWCSSGFANTDLDLLLKKHGIHRLIVVGLITHTCVEATVRYGAELGYDVTVVRDATASYSDAEMHAALDVNMPNYAAVVTTREVVEAIRA